MNLLTQDFLQEALVLYPQSQGEFAELDGLVALQMDEFRIQVEKDMRAKNKDKVLAAFMLIEKAYRYGDEQLKDAVDTCFVEAVFSGHDPDIVTWSWDLLPHILKDLYVDFWGNAPG